MQNIIDRKAPSISWVTVVYRAELDLLQLQARSMAKYLPVDAAQEVVVILNGPNPNKLASQIKEIFQDFGPHLPQVRLIDPSEIFLGPKSMRDARGAILAIARRVLRPLRIGRGSQWRGYAGWHIQQAMKLAVARTVTSDTVVFLDAKNHFIAPVSRADFVTSEGRPRACLERVQDNYFDWHQSARAYLSLDRVDREQLLPPSITPFVSRTATVRATLDRIEKEDGPIEYFFGSGTMRGTEFTLMAAMAEIRDELPTTGLARFKSFFRDASDDEIEDILNIARSGNLQVLGTHSGRLAKMTPTQRSLIADLWISTGLVHDSKDATRILQNYRY